MLLTTCRSNWPSCLRVEDFFRNRPIRNKNCLWQPCLLMDRDKLSILYIEPSIDASYQVLVHLAKRFQRKWFLEIDQLETRTRKNCFRYLILMYPLNAAICTTIGYTLWVEWYNLKTIIWPWGQRSRSHEGHYGAQHTPYGHAPTYQISLTYLKRQKYYGPDNKILFKKQLFDLEVKGQGPTNVITVCNTLPYGHAPTYQI